jgi:branched-chain amino acid transport system permease protein
MPLLTTQTGRFHDSYVAESRINDTGSKKAVVVGGLLLLFLVVPMVADDYQLGVLNLIGIAAVGALGLNLLVGFTGQISLGHAAFAAVGAYTAANLSLRLGLPALIAIPAAGLMAGAVSLLFGVAALRVKGLYLAIATLAAQYSIEWVLNHWSFATGGYQATLLMPPFAIGPWDSSTTVGKYFLIMGILALGVVYAENLFRSRTGRALVAVRDQYLAAEGVGINVFHYKLRAFFISSVYAGIAGALYGYNVGIVTTEFFPLVLSIQFLAMIIIGGLGSIPGSILGAAFVTLIPIVLRDGLPTMGISFSSDIEVYLVQVLFGLTILLFLVLESGGLYRLFNNIRDYFRMWPFSY